jgi:hypothetical protein
MRTFLFLYISFFTFFILSCSDTQKKKNDSPNFILILSDDQGWSSTSVQMSADIESSKSLYFETPNLEITMK